MKWNKDFKKITLGTHEFLDPDGTVYEGEVKANKNGGKLFIRPASLDYHGCGCCGGGLDDPIAWRKQAAMPSWFTPMKGTH
jgi:hypothetical protein